MLVSTLRSRSIRAFAQWNRPISSLKPSDVQIGGSEFTQLVYARTAKDDESQCAMAYSRSFASVVLEVDQLTDTMKHQLMYSKKNNVHPFRNQSSQYQSPNTSPLPRTLADAFRVKSRAVVVTEAIKPFRITDVNMCWENLCGYTYCESKGKTLGSLLKGPETDPVSATMLIAKLLQGEEAGTTLINYTKEGRRFVNRINVGPLKNDSGTVTHFVGVLQEMA